MDPNQIQSSRLASYNSAPTSYLTSLVDRSYEAETILDHLISSCNDSESVRSRSSLGIGSDLARQNSSPPNFFHDNNGYATVRGDRRIDRNGQIGTTLSGFEASENGFKTSLRRTQNIEFGITHQSSLPKDFLMDGGDRVLSFEGGSAIPSTNMRAKRGFATHPRSIAERNRRTRINDRIRKLEGLFPNLDKQANTSHKLESVLEYIKDLQKQIKVLNETKARCLCSSKRHYANKPFCLKNQ